MADDVATCIGGEQRQDEIAIAAQTIDEVGFGRAAECRNQQFSDVGRVARCFLSDR
jgi:hypothetical protein